MANTKLTEKEVRSRFGEKVKEARLKINLSQEKLAFEIGMDLTSVNEIERGHRNPKLNTVFKLSKALKVPSSQLLPF